MIKIEDFAYVLYAKVNRDFDLFELELLGSSAEDIIERADEIVVKTYIIGIFETNDSLSAEEMIELLKLDDTLDTLYEAIKSANVICPFKYKEVIKAYADYLINKSAEAE